MEPSFNQLFEQHTAWRRAFAQGLRQLADWLAQRSLLDAGLNERLERLEQQVRTDQVMVAVVAEFSRGKSELINALFFADYGRRIMPASVGRTTMCPTELRYDSHLPVCLRVLPIQTRLESPTLTEWRMRRDAWEQVPLNVQDPQALADALERVTETIAVSLDEARALGFWNDELPEGNPLPEADGRVQVPRWRHAIINLPHPLLKQGLVVLDTPGLNAVGAEPELTLQLIPQAHAVLFVLGADTGVTRTDLAVWREHLAVTASHAATRWVALNKIDTLWDALDSQEEVQAQLERQRLHCAQVLELPLERVLPVSAQKGLMAKIQKQPALLQASGLPRLEQALAQGIMGQRYAILRAAAANAMTGVGEDASRALRIRRRDIDEQMLELRSLRGKNSSVIDAMRSRIVRERDDFDQSTTRIRAIRSVQVRLLKDLFESLQVQAIKGHMAPLLESAVQSGLKVGIRQAYAQSFDALRQALEQAQQQVAEVHEMLGNTFRQLNAEFGFSLQVPAVPSLHEALQELDALEQGHEQYLGLGHALRLAQKDFSRRFVRAVFSRVRGVFENATAALDQWSTEAGAQLDGQLAERRRSFQRRIEAVDRIQVAADGLDARIREIETSEQELLAWEAELLQHLEHLQQLSEETPFAQPAAA